MRGKRGRALKKHSPQTHKVAGATVFSRGANDGREGGLRAVSVSAHKLVDAFFYRANLQSKLHAALVQSEPFRVESLLRRPLLGSLAEQDAAVRNEGCTSRLEALFRRHDDLFAPHKATLGCQNGRRMLFRGKENTVGLGLECPCVFTVPLCGANAWFTEALAHLELGALLLKHGPRLV